MAGENAHTGVKITVKGEEVDDTAFLGFKIERDIFQPDHAIIELSNQESLHSVHGIGDAVEVLVGDDETSIFKGELVGMTPHFKGDGHTTIQIQAFNKLHRLTRGKSSKTYQNKTDQQILSEVVSKYGLSLDWKHDTNITYKHVYQHNLTDLEFLRTRAARLGCHVWCVDTKVTVKQPNLGEAQTLSVAVTKDSNNDKEAVRWFRPKMNSTKVLKKVTVQGWDPEKKEQIVGEASAASSPLGSKNASSASGDLGSQETFVVDQPIWSQEEAKAIAKGRLLDSALSYITGEMEISGNPTVELGKHVEVTVKADSAQDPFNGKYYIMGIVHINRVEKNKQSKSGEGGFHTQLRLARDGQG